MLVRSYLPRDQGTRSPIELFWTANEYPAKRLADKYQYKEFCQILRGRGWGPQSVYYENPSPPAPPFPVMKERYPHCHEKRDIPHAMDPKKKDMLPAVKIKTEKSEKVAAAEN